MNCIATILPNSRPSRAPGNARRWAVACLLACLALPGWYDVPAAFSQDASPTRLVVYPQAVPSPALKYTLLPRVADQIPGNAVVWYGKVKAEQNHFFTATELWENITDWIEVPLDEVRDSSVIGKYVGSGSIFEFLERGARSEQCDWQLPIRDEPFYTILLPTIQESRSFARLLALRARHQMAHGQYDEAVRTLRSGYALSRNVAKGQTVINGLVGLAEASLMNRQLETLVQQPGAPNLYWALTTLPEPLVDLRPGIETELEHLYLMHPALRNVTDSDRSDIFWQNQLEELLEVVADYADMESLETPFSSVGGLKLFAVRGYPIAKRALVEGGMDAERVEQMSVAQVLLVHLMTRYERIRDEQFKWLYVPYWQSEGEEAERQLVRHQAEPESILPLESLLLPGMVGIRRAMVGSQREIAAMRTVEAIRHYGATHEGRFPESLDACGLPIPIDPVSGKPFDYRVDGNIAVLDGPDIPNRPPFEVHIEFASQPEKE